MNIPFKTQPFLKLLLPLILGILCCRLHCFLVPVFVLFILGIVCLGYSFCIPQKRAYSMRFLFGFGVALTFFCVGFFLTGLQQQSVLLPANQRQKHLAVVLDTPMPKPHSLAYTMCLEPEHKTVLVYLKPSVSPQPLPPGTELMFDAKIRKFTTYSPFDHFDYAAYMTNRGYSGWVYLKQSSCTVTAKKVCSLPIEAMKLRAQLMARFHPDGWTSQESAVAAALLLGYKGDLSTLTKDAFRISGTIHVLSVSGLHVGFIYLFILFLFSWLPNYPWLKRIKLLLIIVCLWFYAFLTGLSPSVVRASVMLTVFCLSGIFLRRSFSLHALYIAAFVILVGNPLSLFDVSFQLSFVSVWFILYFYPKVYRKIRIQNRIVRKIAQFSLLSLCAQLGVFPLCLYYFGTFPVYFFLANLVVIPLVSVIVYFSIVYFLLSLFSSFFHLFTLVWWVSILLHWLLIALIQVTSWFAQLPCAQLSGLFISGCVLLIVYLLIFILTHLSFLRKMIGSVGKLRHKSATDSIDLSKYN